MPSANLKHQSKFYVFLSVTNLQQKQSDVTSVKKKKLTYRDQNVEVAFGTFLNLMIINCSKKRLFLIIKIINAFFSVFHCLKSFLSVQNFKIAFKSK